MWRAIGAFALVVLFSVAAAPCLADDRCAPVHDLKKLGLITEVRSEGYDIYVSKKWYDLPLKTKESTAAAMLECLNPKGKHINIYDGTSGKKIGRFGAAWGFTTYE